MGVAIVWLVNNLVGLMIFLIIASAILSWLVAFDVINVRNRFVGSIVEVLYGLTRPILAPFQRIIPSFGGIDISPIAAILFLQFALIIFNRMAAPSLVGVLG